MISSEHTPASAAVFRQWRKSSYSGGGNGDCLEVSDGHAVVPVRDSKRPDSPALTFPTGSWSSFVAGVKAGELLI